MPPYYCGLTEYSVASVAGSPPSTVSFYSSPGGGPEAIPPGMMNPGDQDFIQFNCQGAIYSINPTAGTTVDPLKRYQASPSPIWRRRFRNQCRIVSSRAAVKGAAQPLQLPAGSVVDLAWSSVVGGGGFGVPFDATVIFLPNGSVALTAGVNPTAPIYLLVGRRERINNNWAHPQTTSNEPLWANFQDLNNIWVIINPQTGLVSTEPVADSSTATTQGPALDASRVLAAQAQGIGGK